MRKFIFLLMVVLALIIGALLMSGGDKSPDNVNKTNFSDKKNNEDSELLEKGQRDTVVNTLQTISARNKKLEREITKLKEAEIKRDKMALKERDVDVIVNKRVKEKSRQIFTEMDDKFERMRSKFEKGINQKDIPPGLGFDDINTKPAGKFSRLESGNKKNTSGDALTRSPGLRVVALSNVMTDKNDNPFSIDGKTIDKNQKLKDKNRREDKVSKNSASENIPFFTIPKNGTLFSNKTMTALLGVVPLRGSLKDPIRFKVITGGTNIATNGLYVPGVKNIVWGGIAIGNREMQCVRGELLSVTFTFEDGTIRTIDAKKGAATGKSKVGGAILGYISDRRGKPCIPGTLISNASDYLQDRIIASGAASAADAAAQTQFSTQTTDNGTLNTFFTGNTGELIASKTLAGGLNELTDYLRERQRDAVDIVYNDAGLDVVIHIEKQIDIDYEPNGRKLNYANRLSSTSNNYQLD